MKKSTPYRRYSALSLPELDTQNSDTASPNIDSQDPIEKLMAHENADGYNIIEQSLSILFEDDDEIYILYLLSNVPNVKKFLHQTSKSNGWLPVFRVLHIF